MYLTQLQIDVKCSAVIMWSIFSEMRTIDLPARARYGMSFVSLKSNLYSASVNTVLYEILYHIRPCYKGTQLYLTHSGSVTPYNNIDLGQNWLRLRLFVLGHKTITWTNADMSSTVFCGNHLRVTKAHELNPQYRFRNYIFKSNYISQGPMS